MEQTFIDQSFKTEPLAQMEKLIMSEEENVSFDEEEEPETLTTFQASSKMEEVFRFPIRTLKQFKKLEELIINNSDCEKLLVSRFY